MPDEELTGKRIIVAETLEMGRILCRFPFDENDVVTMPDNLEEYDIQDDDMIVWVTAPGDYLNRSSAEAEVIGPVDGLEVNEITDTHRLKALATLAECIENGRLQFRRLQG